jgi:hypothetical protein
LRVFIFSPLYLLLIISYAAHSQASGDIEINEQFSSATLIEILDTVDEKYPIDFYYKAEWIPEKKYSIQFQQTSLPKVLSQLFQDTELSFIPYSNYAIVIAPEQELTQEFTQEYFVNKNQASELEGPAEYEILTLGDSAKISPNENATIFGKITDAVTGEALLGATLYIEDLEISLASDVEGKFRMSAPVGVYLAQIRFVGYEPMSQYVRILSSQSWNIDLLPEAFELNEVIVRDETDNSNVTSVQAGIEKLSIQQIKQLPAFLGEADVIKSLLTLPGVSTIGEGASGFNVRGGTIGQNLIMQDEALIFNASHALGFFSVFNSDAIREVVLYKGAIPAQYGGRLSSVLDVKLKGSNYDEFKGKGGIGLVASRLLLEGPIVRDKTSFMIGARSSYSNWILRVMRNPDIKNSAAFFYDINAKVTHRYGAGNSLALSYYQSYDNFRYSDQFGFSWGAQTLNLTWNQIFSPNVSSSLVAGYGNTINESYTPEGTDASTLQNGPTYYKVKQNFFLTPFERHDINAGFEWVRYRSLPETIEKRGDISEVSSQEIEKDDGQEFAWYVNDEFTLNDRISLGLGLRYSLYHQIGPSTVYAYAPGVPRQPSSIVDSTFYGSGEIIQTYSGWEPRLSMKVNLTANSSVKLSYNRLYQYLHLISNTTAAVPVDIWQVSNTYIPPQSANNYSAGYFQNFRNNKWETSVEFFYRDIQNVVEYKDLPQLLLNPYIETETLTGIGRAYGAELSIKRMKGLTTGWLSYTYSRSLSKVNGSTSEESINQGDWFPANFDQPHNLNVSLSVQASRRSRFSFNFTYNTGRPISAPVADYRLGTTVVPHFSERNQFRIPDYHRLDVSYTVDSNIVRRSFFKGSFTFSIYNLYSRDNAFSIFFRRDLQSTANAFKLSVLGSAFPAITYNFEF